MNLELSTIIQDEFINDFLYLILNYFWATKKSSWKIVLSNFHRYIFGKIHVISINISKAMEKSFESKQKICKKHKKKDPVRTRSV